MSTPYTDFVSERLRAGESPNEISHSIKYALQRVATDWVLWGDGRWRQDTVCSICGSDCPGICGHQGQERELILRRVYMDRKRGVRQ